MSIIWLVAWLISNRPSPKGDTLLGLSAWGLALILCLLWDVTSK